MIELKEADWTAIKDYIAGIEWWRSDTPTVIADVFQSMINHGMPQKTAMANIEAIVSAVRDEYGD